LPLSCTGSAGAACTCSTSRRRRCPLFRQLAMLSRIHELVQADSQFIIATHSPIIMAYPDAVIYELTRDGIRRCALEETDHFVIMKQFVNNRERMLQELFG